MFICNKCGEEKEHLEEYREARSFMDRTCYEYFEVTDCHCGGEYTEAVQCIGCRDYHSESKSIAGLCQECYEELLTVKNMVNYLDESDLTSDFIVSQYGYKKYINEHPEQFVEWWKGKLKNEQVNV